LREYLAKFRLLQRHEWWEWGLSLGILLLLTFAVASLSITSILQDSNPLWRSGPFQSIAGLVFLIFLFGTYSTYEKVLINRLRLELIERDSYSSLWRDLALVDPLTGLYNRRFAERRLKIEISTARRKGTAFTIALFDLDGFKQINDLYGHPAGDSVLTTFARHLQQATRAMDTAARLGGDEFMLLLPECDASMLPLLLERLESIEANVDGQRIAVRFSVGWKEYEYGSSEQDLMDAADRALYLNKQDRKQAVLLRHP